MRSATGERFDLKLRQTGRERDLKEGQIVTDFWRQVGIGAEVEITPVALQLNREERAKFSGASTSAVTLDTRWMDRWQSDQTPSEANRWRGSNRGAYIRPEFDRLYQEFITALDPVKRQDVLVQIVRFMAEDVGYMPFYYDVRSFAVRTGLKGLVRPPAEVVDRLSFNAQEWYWE